MKKLILSFVFVIAALVAGWAYYQAVRVGATMGPDQRIDNQFVVAAYVVTWVVQLTYLGWLAVKWGAQKRESARLKRDGRSVD